MPGTILIYFLPILFLQLLVAYKIYSTTLLSTVHYHWYAWVIDIFAILNGIFLMGISFWGFENTQTLSGIFQVDLNNILYYLFFFYFYFIGSWFMCIHLSKIIIRLQIRL